MLQYPPSPQDSARLSAYDKFQKLYLGEHYEAFNIKNTQMGKDYDRLQYLATNFAGLISRLSADMLFEEFPTIRLPDGDDDFIHNLFYKNSLKTQIYESGLEQSFRGDVVFRIRAENKEVVVEDINPACYFPHFDTSNVRAEPDYKALAWTISLGTPTGTTKERMGVFIEKHYKGRIETELYELDGDKLGAKLPLNDYYPDVQEVVQTGVDDFLVVHIPNQRINTMWNGLSDYYDLQPLMQAVNNRLTRIDIILNKHADPILMVPKGVLDDDGKVRREAMGTIEIDTGDSAGTMPQYIVWDANLESAFKEIDRLVDNLFMTGEVSQAAFGMDDGGYAESGRALKYKLLRTIAKKHRKELYYDDGLKRLFFVAQQFAKKNNYTVNGYKIKKDAVIPEIIWKDGVINDTLDAIEAEERALNAGLTTKEDAISRVYGLSETEAKEKMAEIEEEKKNAVPSFNVAPKFDPNMDKGGNQDDGNGKK